MAGQNGGVDRHLVERAAGELYAADPDSFVERRRELAAQARSGGDAEAAKSIAALRKPTRSAWTLNVLAREDPAAFDEVGELGAQLREAERRLDGGQMRDLSRRRRELIDALARKAFATSRQREPSAALREEVNATLLAAVADDDVAEQLRSGMLVRAASWDGFGSGARPELSLVPPPARPQRRTTKPRAPITPVRDEGRIKAVEKEVAAARRLLEKAEAEARKHHDRIDAIEQQLATAQQAATRASHGVREAKAALRQAEQRLARAMR